MGIQEENREKDPKEGFHLAYEPGADEGVRSLWPTLEKPGDKIQQTPAASGEHEDGGCCCYSYSSTVCRLLGDLIVSHKPCEADKVIPISRVEKPRLRGRKCHTP